MTDSKRGIFKTVGSQRRGTTSEKVTLQLRGMIHRGELRPGDRTILFDVRRKTVRRARDLKESAEMHRHIYRAIRDRDPEAARNAMRDHLVLAHKAQESEELESAAAGGITGNGDRMSGESLKISESSSN